MKAVVLVLPRVVEVVFVVAAVSPVRVGVHAEFVEQVGMVERVVPVVVLVVLVVVMVGLVGSFLVEIFFSCFCFFGDFCCWGGFSCCGCCFFLSGFSFGDFPSSLIGMLAVVDVVVAVEVVVVVVVVAVVNVVPVDDAGVLEVAGSLLVFGVAEGVAACNGEFVVPFLDSELDVGVAVVGGALDDTAVVAAAACVGISPLCC